MTQGLHSTVFLISTAVYVVLVCAVGLLSYRKTADEAGFLVAGRSLGPIIGGATLMANQVSAGTTIGVVGFHYFSGISYAWTWPLAWIGWMVAALFVAPKMRDLAGITLPDYFAARFDSRALRAISALLILFAYSVMLSAQYQAGGLLFNLLTGIRYSWAVALVAAITVLYTVLGGMYSNAYVGLLKVTLLIGGYALAVPFLLAHLGGVHSLGEALQSMDPRLTSSWFSWRQLLAISLALGLGIATAPYEISAIYSLSSRKTTRTAIGYSFLFQSFIAVGVLVFGLSMRKLMPYLGDPDLATPVLGMSILPMWMGAIVLLAVVVTLTRTGGAVLLTIASAISHDIYLHFFRPTASEPQKVFASRAAVVTLGALPVAIALRQLDLVNFVVIFSAKMMVSFFFVPVVIGLHWKRGTRAGALWSMCGGTLACLSWSLLGKQFFWGLDAAEAGMITSAILFWGVSLLTQPVPEHCLRVFFRPKATKNL